MRSLISAAMALSLAGCTELPNLIRAPPLDINAPVGALTRYSVAGSTQTLDQCLAVLGAAQVNFTPVADRTQSETCVVEQAGTLDADVGVKSRMSPQRPMMTCRLAAALSVWRRQSVEPAARELLGADVAQIDHLGVYACRSIYNQPGARPSAHSRAAAIDIAGVRLSDGRRITLAGGWSAQGAEAAFLRRIRDDACRVFGVTLSPIITPSTPITCTWRLKAAAFVPKLVPLKEWRLTASALDRSPLRHPL